MKGTDVLPVVGVHCQGRHLATALLTKVSLKQLLILKVASEVEGPGRPSLDVCATGHKQQQRILIEVELCTCCRPCCRCLNDDIKVCKLPLMRCWWHRWRQQPLYRWRAWHWCLCRKRPWGFHRRQRRLCLRLGCCCWWQGWRCLWLQVVKHELRGVHPRLTVLWACTSCARHTDNGSCKLFNFNWNFRSVLI
jgi:hypothetical protein